MHGWSSSTSASKMMSSYRSIRSIIIFLVFVTSSFTHGEVTRYETCYLRCVAGCVETSDLSSCEKQCAPYEQINFCEADDAMCWSVCKDLGPITELSTPLDVHSNYSSGSRRVYWSEVEGATLYAVQYRSSNGNFEEDRAVLTTNTSIDNIHGVSEVFCEPFFVRVAAVSKKALSNFTAEASVESPKPTVSPLLNLVSIQYSSEPFVSDFYQANGTLLITFEFDDMNWPLGLSDLSVIPMFNLINCQVADFSQGVPMAEFMPTTVLRQLRARLGADQMYRRCRYVYYTQSAVSRKCGTETNYYTPPANTLRTLDISCSTVENSPCADSQPIPGPVCGQISNYSIDILTPSTTISADLSMPVSINLTFNPLIRQNEAPTLYYMGVYGEAIPYATADQEAFLGVNQTNIIGTTTNCNGDQVQPCQMSDDNWMIIDNIYLDNLYGLTICAIKNTANLTLPAIPGEPKSSKPKALRIEIDSDPYVISATPLIVGLTVGLSILGLLVLLLCCCYRMRRIRRENENYQIKLREFEIEKESRYTDFPKKNDIWEIDRRNVDVHTNKKLGQGAFGAVYLGKLIGKSLGHHDANSPLGVNLMRTENCQVAIKTLPESADEESKQEFLREIQLMKNIGYHERLVNMLACVTETEPYLLVVEFCSEGDLLQFLRYRCKYMMKLDELGINYVEPTSEDDVDLTLIVTMKQLLMFAVQISYGLEYLSQKGFVHRDVAARNVLVHEGSACKIGDFGLCRQIGRDEDCYKSRGGRLPLKWMSPEAIRDYEFSTKSDVWAFGVLLFEIITLGGCPYPEWPAREVLPNLEKGERMPQPDNCPDEIHSLMRSCWNYNPSMRPDFSLLRQKLAALLEEVTEEYSYLKLDAQQNYYNVQYEDDGKIDVNDIPARLPSNKSKSPTGLNNPAFTVEVESDQ